MIMDEELKKHACFELLDECVEFYNGLSYSTFCYITGGITGKAKEMPVNLDSDIFLSISGSMKSIKRNLYNGQINDVYALIRKYYDVITINIYEIVLLKTELSIENFIVEKIDKWLKGKEKLPGFKKMNELIKECEDLKSINRIFSKDNRYKSIRDRCNDYIHSNYFQYMQLNSKINVQNAKVYIEMINNDLLDLLVLHFGYLFTLNGHYMASSDYIDCLDLNIEPEEDSKYWVAPFIQEFFNKYIKIRRPDISKEIINNTFMDLK
jgi:hypothetical protein